MPATYCIPPQVAKELITAARNGDVIGDIGKLYEMTTQERRDAFSKFVGKDTAKLINTEFEKAMVSNRAKALANWAQKTFTTEVKKKGHLKSALDKIQEADEKGLLTPENEGQFLEDLVTEKLGIAITAQEAKEISNLTKELETYANETSDIGLPNEKWWKAKRKLDEYVMAQTPTNQLRIATSTIGRGMMLASVKSPLVNIESNTIQAVLTGLERRFTSGKTGGVNNAFARKFVSQNMKIYQNSGYDTSRLTSMSEDRKILGEEITHSEGKGAVRKVGRFVEDTVFKQLMGAPDVMFASFHFADSANIGSTKIAQQEGLKGEAMKKRALEIFKDAVLIEPKTIDGEMVRQQAIADAEYATYTNKSTYSDVALAIRGVFNKASGDLRLGDQIMPFVKTPANVVGAGIDYSGVGLPLQLVLLPKAINQLRQGETAAFKKSVRSIVRGGLGLTFAFALSSVIDPEDFMGNYPVTQKEQQLLALKNATPNSVKIGDKWISLDYFGPIAAPFVGMMYAKKYAHDEAEAALKYYQGVGVQALKVPGFQDFQDVVKSVRDVTDEQKTGKEELTTAATNFVLDYIRSRTVPGIVYDIAKATDDVERKVDVKQDPLARIKNAIPGLRQSLDTKTTVFGDPVKAESGLSTILFGSRVKTADENALVQELVRLDGEGQLPSITDVEKSSTRVKELKEQLPEPQFKAAMTYYKDLFKTRVEKVVESRSYEKGNDEKKKALIEEAKEKAVSKMLKKYRYKKPKKD